MARKVDAETVRERRSEQRDLREVAREEARPTTRVSARDLNQATVQMGTGEKPPVEPNWSGHTHPRGAELGRYVVLAPLGAGGMGEVYTAYDPALDRRIALKVIRPFADKGSLATAKNLLLSEAQALAKLSHPHVVHVYDVGTIDDDVYIAMEYIEGTTLYAWLSEQVQPWQDIIGKFVEAGRGLEAAHAAGIIHRDFKLDNVLIGKDGRVRVIDFGIALTRKTAENPDSELGPRSLVGTPAYMAPEQFMGEEVVPASDQFSFAVSLYIALWRQQPFAGDSDAAVRFNVCDGNLTPPPPATNKQNQVPPRIRDAVLRALSRDPAARFASMAALIEAIAPAPRRARWPYVVAGVMTLATAATASVLALRSEPAATPCTGFAADLDGVWGPARKELVKQKVGAEAWPTVERELDTYAEAWVGAKAAACRATQVTREQTPAMMERRMTCLDTRRRELDAAIAIVAGGGVAATRAMEVAGGLRALAVCENLAALAPRPVAAEAALVEVEDGLARLRAMRLAGDYKEARAESARVIDQATRLSWGSAITRALVERGLTESADGDPNAARETLFEAVRRGDEAGDTASVAGAWVGLVAAEGAGRRQPSEALRWAKHAEVALGKAGGDQEQHGQLLHNIAAALRFLDRHAEALEHERRALALFEHAFGTRHVRVANQRGSVANALRLLGNLEDAVREGEAALLLLEELAGKQHVYVATLLNNLGLMYDELGRLDEARRALERALSIRERELGKDHASLANPLMNIVALERRAGRHDVAEALWQRAFKIRVASLGINHPDVTRALHGKLIDRTNRGLDAEARALVDEVVTRHRARTDGIELANAVAIRCELQRRAGDLEAAARSCAEAVRALDKVTDPTRALYTLSYAATLAAQRKQQVEADTLLARAKHALASSTRDHAVARGFVQWAEAHVAAAGGRRDEAAAAARQAVASLTSHGKNFVYITEDLARLQ